MPSASTHPAEQLIRRFLAMVSALDPEGAEMLAPGAIMVFPGGFTTRSYTEMLGRLKARYRRCEKTFDRFDVIDQPSGETIVYCTGTLAGEWADGATYTGIRYIDRFLIRDGHIVDQQVWNDTAFVRPPPSQR